MRGNCIVEQSGGPTAVINAGACGVIQEAMRYPEIDGIYAAHNRIPGILNDELEEQKYPYGDGSEVAEELRRREYRLKNTVSLPGRYSKLIEEAMPGYRGDPIYIGWGSRLKSVPEVDKSSRKGVIAFKE